MQLFCEDKKISVITKSMTEIKQFVFKRSDWLFLHPW
jgi:hypothetical protein